VRLGRFAIAFLAVLAVACGKKGPPLAPFTDLPAKVDELVVSRVGSHVVLRFTVPNMNVDERQPANLSRVDLYMSSSRLQRPADYLERGVLIDSVLVVPPAPEEPVGDQEAPPVPPGVAQGASTTVVFDLDRFELPGPPAAASDEASVEAEDADGPTIRLFPDGGGPLLAPPRVPSLYFVAVGVNRRDREGPPSDVVELPLFEPPPVPGVPQVTYTESALTVSWTPPPMPRRPIQEATLEYRVLASRPLPSIERPPIQDPTPQGSNLPSRPLPSLPTRPIQVTTVEYRALPSTSRVSFITATGYNLYEVAGGEVPELLTGAPLPEPLNARPIADVEYGDSRLAFGTQRCYVVRTHETRGMFVLESEASEPACVTPVDTFAPAAPQNPFLVASEGAISLIWDPNDEPDLAGYLVLRGEAPGETLQALTPAPIPETTYRDTTVAGGVAYVYAVVAVDRTGNVGVPSNRVEERGR
jgi:hypothetical protein